MRAAAISTGIAALLALAILPSCKGRTMENMEPEGETVEVVVQEIADTTVIAGQPAQAPDTRQDASQETQQDSVAPVSMINAETAARILN